MSWSESGKNWLESTKKLNPFGMNWFESTKNMNLSERAKNCLASTRNMNLPATAKNWIQRGKGITIISVSTKDWYESWKNMNWCETAKNGFGKSKRWAEEEIRAKGISDEQRDLLIKRGGALLLAPAIGYMDGFGSACVFILKCAASDDNCREMAKNGLDRTTNWVGMAKSGIEKTKSWAEEKIRAEGIGDERRDLLIKGGGALVAAAAIGYYGGISGACGFLFRRGSSDDVEKLMKAPGRPGELIARAAFEANPKAYFHGLRGKL